MSQTPAGASGDSLDQEESESYYRSSFHHMLI